MITSRPMMKLERSWMSDYTAPFYVDIITSIMFLDQTLLAGQERKPVMPYL